MVRVVPYSTEYEAEAITQMMHCIKEIKDRPFDPQHDEDMLNLGEYYNTAEGSLLLCALATERIGTREKLVGTLGLKNQGIIDSRRTGMLKRLFIEKGYRTPSLIPLFRSMKSWVLQHNYDSIRFVARRRLPIFKTYERIAKVIGMESQPLDEEDLLYTWNLRK